MDIRIPADARFSGSFGFSLLEVLVAMTLLTLGLLGVARLSAVAISGNHYSRSVSTASVLGQEVLEDARRTAGLPLTHTEEYGSIAGYPEFKRIVTVEQNAPEPGLSTLTVTVQWDDDARSLRLQTIILP